MFAIENTLKLPDSLLGSRLNSVYKSVGRLTFDNEVVWFALVMYRRIAYLTNSCLLVEVLSDPVLFVLFISFSRRSWIFASNLLYSKLFWRTHFVGGEITLGATAGFLQKHLLLRVYNETMKLCGCEARINEGTSAFRKQTKQLPGGWFYISTTNKYV